MPVVRISDELFQEVQKYAEPLVDNFESALWKALNKKIKSFGSSMATMIPPRKIRKPRSQAIGELTRSSEYIRPILEIILNNGGSSPRPEVHKLLKRKFEGRFKPGDKELNRDGTLKWEKQVDWRRLIMRQEGLLKDDSPPGLWEISERGEQWIKNHELMP